MKVTYAIAILLCSTWSSKCDVVLANNSLCVSNNDNDDGVFMNESWAYTVW